MNYFSVDCIESRHGLVKIPTIFYSDFFVKIKCHVLLLLFQFNFEVRSLSANASYTNVAIYLFQLLYYMCNMCNYYIIYKLYTVSCSRMIPCVHKYSKWNN